MSLDALRDSIPDYAKDIRLNLGTLAAETALSEMILNSWISDVF